MDIIAYGSDYGGSKMELDIRGLKNQKEGIIEAEFNQQLESDALKSLQAEFVSPPRVYIKAFRNGDLITVSGTVTVKLRLSCVRCLEPFTKIFNENFMVYYSSNPEEQDEEIKQLIGSKIDLEPLVLDSIILALPMKLLCGENCKGLCSICGQNLNERECGCERVDIDPRLADLKKLLDT